MIEPSLEPPSGPLRFHRTTLQTIKVAMTEVLREAGVGPAAAGAVDVELLQAAADREARRWALELSTRVLAEQLPPVEVREQKAVTFEYPAGWWEAFRFQYRMRWWMRRWVARRPVRMRTERRTVTFVVHLDRYQTFPRATATLPDLGQPVAVSMVRWR